MYTGACRKWGKEGEACYGAERLQKNGRIIHSEKYSEQRQFAPNGGQADQQTGGTKKAPPLFPFLLFLLQKWLSQAPLLTGRRVGLYPSQPSSAEPQASFLSSSSSSDAVENFGRKLFAVAVAEEGEGGRPPQPQTGLPPMGGEEARGEEKEEGKGSLGL